MRRYLSQLPRALRLSRRLGNFLFGQAAAQLVGLLSGLVVLWLLPPREYALYIVSMAVLAIGGVASDLGVSQAVITCGAKAVRGGTGGLSSLYAAAQLIRRQLYWLALPAMIAVGVIMMFGHEWTAEAAFACLVLTVVMNFFQQRVTLGTSVLNIYQDANGRFHTIFWPNGLRLVLSASLFVWPSALAAVMVNLLALVVQAMIVERRVRARIDPAAAPAADSIAQIRNFFIPLIPGVVYYMLQGQLSVFLLSWSGNTISVAEVGAIGRLSQVLALAGLLNQFFVQPHFAQIDDTGRFARRALALLLLLFSASALLVASAVLFPRIWLFILGPHYDHLGYVLVWAIAGALSYTLAATVYTIVVATGNTRLQWLQIPFGLGSQLLFIAWNGVATTRDGVILNTLPALVALILEIALLATVVIRPRPSR